MKITRSQKKENTKDDVSIKNLNYWAT